MKSFGTWVAGVCLASALIGGNAVAQEKKTLDNQRDKVSYAIGMDIGRSFVPVADYIDPASLQTALQGALKGDKPALSEADAQATDTALRANLAAKAGQTPPGQPPGTQPPEVNKQHVGSLIGGYMIGPKLAPLKDEVELPVLMQAVRTVFAKGTTLLTEAEAQQVVQSYASERQAGLSQRNRDEGAAFLSKNKTVKGVVTTASGLQYMVLRQGSGERPTAASTVRVNYEGKLLDGTKFDSSYDRGEPASFPLANVVPGWTEGLQLMPVGSKYRFWVPSQLGYGEAGTQGGPIGPNATLTFDVELIGIVK
ncbi:FKBP-type peptidyl-prolyl cis-trans isomerase [Pseudoxanthomonas sp.]|uniref:FKBP-type peptidyl-prolyl cis-trans isomerase n=1 Tax=Pseudoxanthomonas sp. TaxID=1871049 RepID=UPI00260E7187|nr:FKBP-type peptidyl-prolyl cis-trans isomerase [Pseudoxanthomonas sp.]WDS37099.1 MAG: FKBP-type peptidyl-prolyl cis-trans isomerase [Pseudoxanthomonas sp.]